MDAGRSPGRVLGGHEEDDIPHPSRRFFPARFLLLEVNLQCRRKPARCQRTAVSGVTRIKDCFHPDQKRRVTIQNSRSKLLREALDVAVPIRQVVGARRDFPGEWFTGNKRGERLFPKTASDIGAWQPVITEGRQSERGPAPSGAGWNFGER